MSRFNTGNPLDSDRLEDLSDNAKNVDLFSNDTKNKSYTDRFGKKRRTIHSMESDFDADQKYRSDKFSEDQIDRESKFIASQKDKQDRFNDFIASSGYQYVGDYAAGVELTEYNQLVRDDSGEFWRASGTTTLPYTLTGAGVDEGGALVSVGDASLRQDLANPDRGAAMIARGVVALESIQDLLGLPKTSRRTDLLYMVRSYHYGESLGGGLFYWDPLQTHVNDGGVVLSGFIRCIEDNILRPEYFGALYDGSDTLVDVDYYSDRPESRVRVLRQTKEAEALNKCIRYARGNQSIEYKILLSGLINVYGYLEPLDFNVTIEGVSESQSVLKSLETTPTDNNGFGVIVCGGEAVAPDITVTLRNLKVDGNAHNRVKPSKEFRVYNIVSYTNSRLHLKRVTSVNSPIDCLNISGKFAIAEQVTLADSYRNTLTCGSVKERAIFVDCDISGGGTVHGGTNPRYCVDVEPNVSARPAELVEFIRCNISRARNSLVGAVWSTTSWNDCVFDGSEKVLESQSSSFPWLGSWAQGNHTISNCLFIGNSERKNAVHGHNVAHAGSDFGYNSRLVFKDNLFKGCGMRLFGFNAEVIGNRLENSAKGIYALKPNNIDTQRFVIKDNYLYNVIPATNGEQAALQVQAFVNGEVLVEGNTVVFDRDELEWVDGVILEPLTRIYAFSVGKPTSGTSIGTRIILNNTAINYYKEYIEGLIPLTESASIYRWSTVSSDSSAENWPPKPDDPPFYRGNL